MRLPMTNLFSNSNKFGIFRVFRFGTYVCLQLIKTVVQPYKICRIKTKMLPFYFIVVSVFFYELQLAKSKNRYSRCTHIVF